MACFPLQLQDNIVLYDTSDSSYPNIYLEKLTIFKSSPRLLSITYRLTRTENFQTLTGEELSGVWFIDHKPVATSSTIQGIKFQSSKKFWGHTWCESSLNTNAPRADLTKSYINKIRYEAQIVTGGNPEPGTLDDYRIVKYEIEIKFSDIMSRIPVDKEKIDIEFENLQYKIYTNGIEEKERSFTLDLDKPQYDRVVPAFDGVFTHDDAGKRQLFYNGFYDRKEDIVFNGRAFNLSKEGVSPESTPKSFYLVVKDSFIDKSEGTITIAVETSNALNSKVKVSFDITSQVYTEKFANEKFPSSPAILWVSSLGGISCRAFGTNLMLHNRISMQHILPNGRMVTLNELVSIYGVYSAIKYYNIPDEENYGGTYICSITGRSADNDIRLLRIYHYI